MAAPEIQTVEKDLSDSRIFPGLIRAADLDHSDSAQNSADRKSPFTLAALSGRLVELGACRPSACLSLSCSLLLEAQGNSVPAAWISVTRDTFFPPDLAANGVNLSILPVVWMPDARCAVQAADWLLRTGAFGLIVIDLYRNSRLPQSLQARLAQPARRHACAVVFLTVKPEAAPSLGSMISLYARVRRSRCKGGGFRLALQVEKDKRRAPVWEHVEYVDGSPGLC